MKNVAIDTLLVLPLILVGCSTPKGEITTIANGNTITYRETRNEEPSPYSIKIEKVSTIVSLDYGKPEPPTLPQLCEYSRLIFNQKIKPKLESGEALSNEELVILACCMNVRISMIKALNGTILSAMDLPVESASTYGLVPHPKLLQNPDVAKKRYADLEAKRYKAEQEFANSLNTLAPSSSDMQHIQNWGETFTGDETFTLGIDERKELLSYILGRNEGAMSVDYLERSEWKRWLDWCAWYGVGEIVNGYRARNAVKQDLPNFQDKYRRRISNTEWKIGVQGYDNCLAILSDMYSSISNGTHVAVADTGADKRQFDRLKDLENQFYNVLHDGQRNAKCLTEDYPFALTMVEGMKMMRFYYQREFHGHTPDVVQERYRRIARHLCKFTKSIMMTEIHNKGLRDLYEKQYVAFLMKSLNKSSDELYRDYLIPFPVNSAK